MSKWTKFKILIGVIVSIFVILVIVFLINISSFINNKYEQSSKVQVVDNKEVLDNKLDIYDNIAEIVRQTAVKNGKWEDLPLSKTFKKKYNSKDGILADDNYTKLTWSLSGTDTQRQIVTLIVFHNSKKEYYYIHYTLNENNELDDVEIVDKKLLYDENGNEVIYKETMDGAFVSNIVLLAAPGRLEYDPFKYIYVTDNYLNKWSGGFIDYNISCGIEDISGLEDKEHQLVYLYVVQDKFDENGAIIGDEWEKYYKVHYFVDNNFWLDDVEVEEVSKEEIGRLLSEKERENK